MRPASKKWNHGVIWCGGVIAAAALTGASVAQGDMVISSSRYTSGTNEVVVFRALNDGNGDQAKTTKIQSVSVILQSAGNAMIFNFQDVDGDGATDANVKGVGFAYPANQSSTMPTGSFVRIGSTSSFFIPSTGTSPQAFTDADGDGTPDGNDPVAAYAGLTQFSVQGALPGGGVTANVSPVPFALALVPAGTSVSFTGQLAAESGPIENVSGSNVPEPRGIAFMLIAALALTLRRRGRPKAESAAL